VEDQEGGIPCTARSRGIGEECTTGGTPADPPHGNMVHISTCQLRLVDSGDRAVSNTFVQASNNSIRMDEKVYLNNQAPDLFALKTALGYSRP
jgi:hypothetical protein